tara:strand:+ start:110 stop:535 length:426 start_codon:yes stop_codon:yes gene_type:complete
MAKKISGYIKLQIAAGQANPSPPVGPALGQKGVNIMEFCKAFNASTQKMEAGMPIPVVITVYVDKSFTFETKSPPVSFFIKKAIKLKKGSKTPGKEVIASISMQDIKKIAEDKISDLNTDEISSAEKMVAGTARSMGIKVE